MSDWKDYFHKIFKDQEEKKTQDEEKIKQREEAALNFIGDVVLPAFKGLKPEFEIEGKEVNINSGPFSASISIIYKYVTELSFHLIVDIGPNFSTVRTEEHFTLKEDGQEYKAERVFYGSGNMSEITKEIIIDAVIKLYKEKVLGIY